MKIPFYKNRILKKSRRILAAVLIGCMLLSLAGCGEKKQEATTEANKTDENAITDADGFRFSFGVYGKGKKGEGHQKKAGRRRKTA